MWFMCSDLEMNGKTYEKQCKAIKKIVTNTTPTETKIRVGTKRQPRDDQNNGPWYGFGALILYQIWCTHTHTVAAAQRSLSTSWQISIIHFGHDIWYRSFSEWRENIGMIVDTRYLHLEYYNYTIFLLLLVRWPLASLLNAFRNCKLVFFVFFFVSNFYLNSIAKNSDHKTNCFS